MDILSLPDNEPFIAGTDESIDICSNQIMKLSDASICHCRRGKAAQFENLGELVKNTIFVA